MLIRKYTFMELALRLLLELPNLSSIKEHKFKNIRTVKRIFRRIDSSEPLFR